MMKTLLTLMLLLCCGAGRADCVDTIFEYEDTKMKISMGFKEGCYKGELILFYTVPKNKKVTDATFEDYVEISFEQECPQQQSDGEFIKAFSCRKDGQSPLAGAHYTVKRYAAELECEGVVYPVEKFMYVCTEGCTAHTPKQLVLPYSGGTC